MSFFIIYPPISPDFTYLWDRKRKPNNRMQLLYVIGTGVLAAFCVLLAVRICYQRRYIRTSDRINDCIFRNVAAYLLLIDPDFNVLQTNYRSATGTAPQAVPPKVGNLLRCRNGEDAGVCGTHIGRWLIQVADAPGSASPSGPWTSTVTRASATTASPRASFRDANRMPAAASRTPSTSCARVSATCS